MKRKKNICLLLLLLLLPSSVYATGYFSQLVSVELGSIVFSKVRKNHLGVLSNENSTDVKESTSTSSTTSAFSSTTMYEENELNNTLTTTSSELPRNVRESENSLEND